MISRSLLQAPFSESETCRVKLVVKGSIFDFASLKDKSASRGFSTVREVLCGMCVGLNEIW